MHVVRSERQRVTVDFLCAWMKLNVKAEWKYISATFLPIDEFTEDAYKMLC